MTLARMPIFGWYMLVTAGMRGGEHRDCHPDHAVMVGSRSGFVVNEFPAVASAWTMSPREAAVIEWRSFSAPAAQEPDFD